MSNKWTCRIPGKPHVLSVKLQRPAVSRAIAFTSNKWMQWMSVISAKRSSRKRRRIIEWWCDQWSLSGRSVVLFVQQCSVRSIAHSLSRWVGHTRVYLYRLSAHSPARVCVCGVRRLAKCMGLLPETRTAAQPVAFAVDCRSRRHTRLVVVSSAYGTFSRWWASSS